MTLAQTNVFSATYNTCADTNQPDIIIPFTDTIDVGGLLYTTTYDDKAGVGSMAISQTGSDGLRFECTTTGFTEPRWRFQRTGSRRAMVK